MFPVKLLILVTIFCKLTHPLESCQKGQRVITGGCAECPRDHFQPEENHSMSCRVCTRCEKKFWSYAVENCTKMTNTKCACRGKFVPKDTTDSSTCMCKAGFGLKGNECLECEDGYFSTTTNVPCRKWRECKFTGIKVNGTSTSDVICNEEPHGFTRPVTTNSPSKEVVSLSLPVTPNSPHEGNQSHEMLTTTTAPPPGVSIQTTSMKPSNMSNFFGILITFTTVGLLVLIALTLKLFASPHVETECEQQGEKHESLCQPVMEIGDRSCSYIKLNPDVV